MPVHALFDTHLHLIIRRTLRYPWLACIPALNPDFHLERYQTEALRCGLDGALHMEVNVAEADIETETRHVEALAKRPGSPLRGAISSCRPEKADFHAFLERQLADPFVKGFRRPLHIAPDELSLSPIFRANLGRLGGTGRPFDLCVRPDQIHNAIALVDLCPDVQFVLDHCGVPAINELGEHPWRKRIVQIASRPNVAVKISGVVSYAAPEGWTVNDIRPYVEHSIGCFGWDRVVWGSDWGISTRTGSLSTWVAATVAITAGCSESERGRLFRDNAHRIWRLT